MNTSHEIKFDRFSKNFRDVQIAVANYLGRKPYILIPQEDRLAHDYVDYHAH